MDSVSPHPAKRRKLSNCEGDNDTSLPAAFSNYLTLAEATFCVTVEVSEGRRVLDVPQDGSPIAVTVQVTGGQYNKFEVSNPTLSRYASITLASAPSTLYEEDVLRDMNRLTSTLRFINKPKIPIACCHASLSLQEGQTILSLKLMWQNSIRIHEKFHTVYRDILQRYLPGEDSDMPLAPERWEPRHFYDAVHVPEKTREASAGIEIQQLKSQLYPFQQRTVRWMLSKEGVEVETNGSVSPVATRRQMQLPRGFVPCKTRTGQACYVHHALGVVSSSLEDVQNAYGSITGGLLADEMGLGKTLSVISVACLHRRSDVHDETSRGRLRSGPQKSGATLIITPPTILEQWKQELEEHAPTLKVHHYQGIKLSKKSTKEVVAELATQDIVLTTYNVIAKEVHYVAERPDRSLRNRPRFEPPKSPLTEISWWRVCLDEAQMVDSGVSAAATVARLIPREIAWAVTGTPVRKGHEDLFGLFLFLRYEPYCHSKVVWNYLVHYHRPMIQYLIKEVAIRHTKDFVREDLRLPPQSRHTITLPFTAIEEQQYQQLFTEMCEEVGLDGAGAPLQGEWDPDDPVTIEKTRRWLTRLRQTCLHPEVGVRNRRALGRNAGPLRTVQQVLDVMIEQNEGVIRTEQRNLLMSRIRRGQLQENAKNTNAALEIWRAAYQESCDIVGECREQLAKETELQKAAEKNKKDSAEAKGTAEDGDDDDDDNDDEEGDADAKLQMHRQRLRSALEVKHICIFFMANAYFQLKSNETVVDPDSEEFHALEKQETEAYDVAKKIRGELLTEVRRKANRAITTIRTKVSESRLAILPQMEAPTEYTGIESRKIFDKLDDFCLSMNAQAKCFNELRQKMVDFLRQALIDEDEGVELQGDEYETSTRHQDEMYAYMEALRAHCADRSDAISGQENLLIRQEVKQFLRSAKEGEGPAPGIMLKLFAERDTVRIDPTKQGSLRGILAEIRQLVTALQWQEAGGSSRARAELEIASKLLEQAQSLVSVQSKALGPLEQEVNLFKDTMNSRLDYYRALQKISDTVAPYDEEHIGEALDLAVFDRMQHHEQAVADKLSTLLSKRRYLVHLKTESTTSSRICTICQNEFEIGTLTVCGHQFCKECIQLWWHENRNCPICKQRLTRENFHDITYKPAEMVVQGEELASGSESPTSSSDESARSPAIYSDVSAQKLNEIKNIDLPGAASFGSKVDMLIRHLLWIRANDPGTKSIIFSQYREFLHVLSRAFDQFHVTSSAFDDKNGIEKFKSDPAVECFLLHAKAHSAGLNLVCASHVFLCEPLLATAVELQAIARVHRIGQHRATTVWMYVINGTVEESIYEMSVARRLAHIHRTVKGKGKSMDSSVKTSGTVTPNGVGLQENAIDLANSLELQAADLSKLLTSGKSGGEMVHKDDLWQCLFGKVKQRERVMRPEDLPAGSQLGSILRAEAAERRRQGV